MNGSEVLLSASDETKLLKTSLRTLTLMSLEPLPPFPSRTNLKLHIPVTPRLVKKVLTSLDSAKASGPDCIPVLILKNCEAKFSLILTELFNMCLARSCFSDFWKVSSVVTVLKNVGERSTTRNYHPDSLLSVATNIFEKLVNTVVGPQSAGFYETGYTGQKN